MALHRPRSMYHLGYVVHVVYPRRLANRSDVLRVNYSRSVSSMKTFTTGHANGIRALTVSDHAQVPLSEQWLVQGDLFYRLEGVDSGDEQAEDIVVVDLPRILNESIQSAELGRATSAPLPVRQAHQLKVDGGTLKHSDGQTNGQTNRQ